MALGKKTLDKTVEEIQQKEDPTASFSMKMQFFLHRVKILL